ncbi:hypothetical protein RI129_009544 [Pyrocoelia pectoralis]|uniref:CHK kinase-like domain-containing protein n=1 Tax=Pyrocoelia pectoralis TaxID=417401 RepID=A0AAN7ZF02_9COLE
MTENPVGKDSEVNREAVETLTCQPAMNKSLGDNRLFLKLELFQNTIMALVDTGAARSYIGTRVRNLLEQQNILPVHQQAAQVQLAEGSLVRTWGLYRFNIRLEQHILRIECQYLPELASDIIVGEHILAEKGKGISSKLTPKYAGPFPIKRIISPVIVEVQTDRKRNRLQRVHVKDLKVVGQDEPEVEPSSTPPPEDREGRASPETPRSGENRISLCAMAPVKRTIKKPKVRVYPWVPNQYCRKRGVPLAFISRAPGPICITGQVEDMTARMKRLFGSPYSPLKKQREESPDRKEENTPSPMGNWPALPTPDSGLAAMCLIEPVEWETIIPTWENNEAKNLPELGIKRIEITPEEREVVPAAAEIEEEEAPQVHLTSPGKLSRQERRRLKRNKRRVVVKVGQHDFIRMKKQERESLGLGNRRHPGEEIISQLGKVAPEVYYSSTKPLPILLLEDLSASNYKVLERRKGLDLSQCLLAVEKLARFHAASFVLYKKDFSALIKFNKSVFGRQGLISNLLSISYNEVIKLCQKVPELNGYVEKMKSSQERILRGIGNVHNINSKFKVLNHGDFWINNMLFRYDQHGNEEDVLFIDFQTPCFSSPCLDLHYFLAGNLSYSTRCKENAIIDHYFHTLIKSLNKLYVTSLPNRNDFDEDFRLMSCYGFAASILSLALIRSNPLENSSLHNFLEDNTTNGFRYRCFNSEEYLKEVIHYLPFYDKLGLFDARE